MPVGATGGYTRRMLPLEPNECRVLGVLVEKATTTPSQYPMTLNALVAGSNQRSNRDPVLQLDEDAVYGALDGLRRKGLSREVMLSGSRVQKFRHVATEALDVPKSALVLLTELLLRGPQTSGELRGRASRMHPLESTDVVESVLAALMERDPPLVRTLPPAAGGRAKRYAQLLCPDLHPLDAPAGAVAPATTSAPAAAASTPPPAADDARVASLERRVETLESELRALREALGVADPEPAA